MQNHPQKAQKYKKKTKPNPKCGTNRPQAHLFTV